MVVFTRKYPIQRLLKKRFFKKNKIPKLRYGTVGIYCLHTFRFEYKYCLFLRKFFKKMFKRRKRKISTIYRRKTWLFVRPNYTLTRKSKNARMGKGKGNFKRWCTIIHPGRVFIEHSNVTPTVYKIFVKKIKIKLKVHLKMLHLAYNTVKKRNLNGGICNFVDRHDLLKIRKNLFINL